MHRFLASLAEQHAEVAQRNQQQRGTEFIQQALCSLHQIVILQWIRIARFIGNLRQFKCFLAVGRNERERREVQMVNRLGVHAQPQAALMAQGFHAFEQ